MKKVISLIAAIGLALSASVSADIAKPVKECTDNVVVDAQIKGGGRVLVCLLPQNITAAYLDYKGKQDVIVGRTGTIQAGGNVEGKFAGVSMWVGNDRMAVSLHEPYEGSEYIKVFKGNYENRKLVGKSTIKVTEGNVFGYAHNNDLAPVAYEKQLPIGFYNVD